jgi:D-aminopeptidase
MDFTEPDPTFMRLSREGVLSPLYLATVEATEEAIINALFKAETMTGFNGHVRHALPLDEIREVLEKYRRI